ncbi:uncharacterized protein ATC70_001494 [Mucor velutinosus]|uniref:Plus3 domain-containing protein n=1 Tax=Mucor velutinosus TaxID=708070 RepID=A0AAN7DJY9_9FUNG|nr:hypothetical protein ATC70_001494 [Mucor velutinosus]
MDNIDDLILSLTDKQAEDARRRDHASNRSSKKSKKYLSESEDDEGAYSDEDDVGIDDDEDMEDIDEYGPDLYKDEDDRRRLQALPEVERERILAERSEERQRNLERLEVRKLLKDGRRDDATRRSTRSKGSGTSSALSELTRRREEKNKVRSKRHRRDSPSPDRKRRRRYGDQSDYEYSGEEYNDSEEETEKKAKKRTPNLEEIQSVSVSRNMIEKWIFAPFFENTVIGCFVRLYIGPDPQKKVPVYRLCQIIDVVPWHKTYKIGESTHSNKALKVKHGKAEKDFPMDIVSNQPVTQQEFTRFLTTLESDRVRVPTIDQIEQKAADLKQAKEYVLNDKEVNEMIEKKKAVKGSSVNAAMEKAQLLARLEHAKAHNEVEKVLKLSRDLKELEERIALAEGAHQNVWADINSRNRNRDRIEVHEAERRATEARRRALLENTKAAAAAAAAAAASSQPEGVSSATTTASTIKETATDSSLMPMEKTGRPLAKLITLSKHALNVGEATSYQTEYEKLVSKVAMEVRIELLEDSPA